jgi:Fe-S-cluster containining protein
VPTPELRNLKFRCTGCGNCCKDPLLPLTDADLSRIVAHTGDAPDEIVRWVDRHGIDMDDEPEAFVMLRQGKRVMVLAQNRRGCRYLDADNRCTIYGHRPDGCRVFPFDPTFGRDGTLRRLRIVKVTECPYELDGDNDPERIRHQQERYDDAHARYFEKVKSWNALQTSRKRQGLGALTAARFLEFLGFTHGRPGLPRKRPGAVTAV